MARGPLQVDAQPIDALGAAPLLGAGYGAFNAGNIEAFLDGLDPAIVWNEPGDNPAAGTYKGRDEVRGFFEGLARGSGGTFHIEVREVVARAGHLVALVTEHATAGGSRLAAAAVRVWRIGGAGLSELQNHYADQATVDRFWSGAA